MIYAVFLPIHQYANIVQDVFFSHCVTMGLAIEVGVGLSLAWFSKFSDIYGVSEVYGAEFCMGLCLGGDFIMCEQPDKTMKACGGSLEVGAGAGVDVHYQLCQTWGFARYLPGWKDYTV